LRKVKSNKKLLKYSGLQNPRFVEVRVLIENEFPENAVASQTVNAVEAQTADIDEAQTTKVDASQTVNAIEAQTVDIDEALTTKVDASQTVNTVEARPNKAVVASQSDNAIASQADNADKAQTVNALTSPKLEVQTVNASPNVEVQIARPNEIRLQSREGHNNFRSLFGSDDDEVMGDLEYEQLSQALSKRKRIARKKSENHGSDSSDAETKPKKKIKSMKAGKTITTTKYLLPKIDGFICGFVN
jgi:hypothetical protein